MIRSVITQRFPFLLCLCLALIAVAHVNVVCQSKKPLTNADVVGMTKQKIAPETIQAVIMNSPETRFDISAAALAKLKRAGVAGAVVNTMIEQTKPSAIQTTSDNSSSGAAAASKPLRVKRRGVIRIGIVTTTSNVPPEQDEAIRAQFYELLYGNRESSVSEAVLMGEKLDRNIGFEAIQTKCDYLLYISLDSTIHSAAEKRGNFISNAVRGTTEALGAASKMTNPLSALSGITYRSYQLADSLSTSKTLLNSVTQATKKKDRIGINFKLVKVGTKEEIVGQSLREIIAKKDKEPILQNLLISLGNEILGKIPVR
ncbi:MAG: hypothetical protein ACKVRN_04060 [Pyrinomonadaceae bacterium]